MDYQGKYNGPQIDRRLDSATKRSGIEPLRVIAGKRIPKENFGPVGTIRFATKPALFVYDEEIEERDDRIYAPVFAALLRDNILTSTKFAPVDGGYIEVTEDGDAFEHRQYQFEYSSGMANAILKTGEDSYKAIIVGRAKTQTDNLIIVGGRIACVEPAGASVFVDIEKDKARTSIVVNIPQRSIIEYHHTGKHPRTTIGGFVTNKRRKYLTLTVEQESFHGLKKKKKKWIFAPGVYRWYNNDFTKDGDDKSYICGLAKFRANGRVQLKCRVRPVYKKRWKSPYYKEINEVVLV